MRTSAADPGARQKGVAILTVITALAALIVIAVPFLITMRVAYERSETNRARRAARNQADSIMSFLESYLVRTTERVERTLRESDANADNNDPECDAQTEIEPTVADVANALGVRPEDLEDPYGTIVGWQVRDENGKLNINDCSYFALGNLLGLSKLAEELSDGTASVLLEDATGFPSKGYVLVDRELISYDSRSGNRLLGCRRGLSSDRAEHSKSDLHKKGRVVVNYAAWAVCYYPLMPQQVGQDRKRILYHPWRSLDVSLIAELQPRGVQIPILTRADWERVLPFVTIWSKGPVGEGWGNVQAVTAATGLPSKDDQGDQMVVESTAYYNPGTVVRLQEKAQENVDEKTARERIAARPKRIDHGMVFSAGGGGSGNIRLFGKAHRRFDGNQMQLQYRIRQPVNVNTASRKVLVAIFSHLQQLSTPNDSVTVQEAEALADAIRKRAADGEPLRSMREFEALLRKLKEDNTISEHDRVALFRNGLNPQDQGLYFGTTPICFRTYDVYGLTVNVLRNNRGGKLMAKHRQERVVEIGSQLTTERLWETQRQFEDQLVATNDPKYWASGPNNTGRFTAPKIEPWPRWPNPLFQRIFPYDPYGGKDEADMPGGVRTGRLNQFALNGDIRLAPARMEHETALVDAFPVIHFDYARNVEGMRVQGGFPLGKGMRGGGRQPFSVQFWWKPLSGGDATLFDMGEEEFTNRIGCFVDGSTSELVFRVADNTEARRACELRYDISESGGLQDDVWYHVHLIATGCHPSKMTMLIDGRAVGRPTIMTYLTGDLGRDDGSVGVENADGFPDSGAIQIGMEVIEYESRGGNSFTVVGGQSNSNNNAPAVGRGARGTPRLDHPEGAPVTLFGYSRPIVEDVRTGGAQLVGQLGPWSPTRFNTWLSHQDNPIPAQQAFADFSPNAKFRDFLRTDPQDPDFQVLVRVWTLPFDGGELSGPLTAWDASPTDPDAPNVLEDELRAFQEDGYALVTYVGGTASAFENVENSLDQIDGRVEFMSFDGSGGTVTLTRDGNSAGSQTAPEQDEDYEILLGVEWVGWFFLDRWPNPTKTWPAIWKSRIAIAPVSVKVSGGAGGNEYANPVDHVHMVHWLMQIKGGGDQASWEWDRYSEILQGNGTYFLQARVQDSDQMVAASGVPVALMKNRLGHIPTAADDVTGGAPPGGGPNGGPGGPDGGALGPGGVGGMLMLQTPPPPATGGAPAQQQPGRGPSPTRWASILHFRGAQDGYRRTTGRWADPDNPVHESGSEIIPIFATYRGPPPGTGGRAGIDYSIWPRPGYPDTVDLVSGNDQAREGGLTVFHAMNGNHGNFRDPARGAPRPWDFAWSVDVVALSEQIGATYPATPGMNPSKRDNRDLTRLLCFPTGEMPDNAEVLTAPQIARSIDGDATDSFIDEIGIRARGVSYPLTLVNEELNAEDQTIVAVTPGGTVGGNEGPAGPGLLRIGEELVVYVTATQQGRRVEFGGCVRGVLRTEARSYTRGAPIEALPGVTVGVLTEGAQESSPNMVGVGFDRFPRIGCVRLEDPDADQAELRIYTLRDAAALRMPIHPRGGGLFVARYGTVARSWDAGTPVFWQPIRGWDRFAEFSTDPEISFWSFNTQLRGAYFKRLYWQEVLAPGVYFRILMRLNEDAPWDALSSRTIIMSQLGGRDIAPRSYDGNPYKYLRRFEFHKGDNFVGLQADRVEMRVFVIYRNGAYRWADPSARGWKTTPLLQQMALEYVQPNRIWRHVDTR